MSIVEPVSYSFKTTHSIFKKFYVFSKYLYLFRNYLKLLLNYFIILFKKITTHFVGFFINFELKFAKAYFLHINVFKTLL